MKSSAIRNLLIGYLIAFSTATAQDYRLFDPAAPHCFTTTGTGSFMFSGMNSYSQSPLKVTRIDSVATTPGGTTLYPFRTWRDTITFMEFCSIKCGPSWMGSSIFEMNNGTTWLLNTDLDSIRIDQLANAGSTWTMMQLRQGGRIDATVDSLFITTCIGITDSVKQLRLSALDSAGNYDLSHPLHGALLWISKHNGLFKGLSFRDLPGYIRLDRVDSIQEFTFGQIYDYSTGDEFEFIRNYTNSGNTYPPSYFYVRVDDKWFSAQQDTVYYSLFEAGLNFTFNPWPAPHLDTVYTESVDTISYTDLNRPLYGAVPEENTLLELHPGNFGTYYINKDTAFYHNRPLVGEVTGFLWDADSCVMINHFEPSFYTKEVAPGLGEVMTIRDDRSLAGPYYQSRMIWFRKGMETYGTFYNVFVGMDEPQENRDVVVYPNPANNEITLKYIPGVFTSGEIHSMEGHLLMQFNVGGSMTALSLRDLPSGLLTLRLTGDSKQAVLKIVHTNQ